MAYSPGLTSDTSACPPGIAALSPLQICVDQYHNSIVLPRTIPPHVIAKRDLVFYRLNIGKDASYNSSQVGF